MKKAYISPVTTTVMIQTTTILAGSPDAKVYNEEGNGTVYSRGNSFWDDEEEEE